MINIIYLVLVLHFCKYIFILWIIIYIYIYNTNDYIKKYDKKMMCKIYNIIMFKIIKNNNKIKKMYNINVSAFNKSKY